MLTVPSLGAILRGSPRSPPGLNGADVGSNVGRPGGSRAVANDWKEEQTTRRSDITERPRDQEELRCAD